MGSSSARALVASVLATVACGDEGGPGVRALISVDGALAAETSVLQLYALGPERTDKVMLTCGTLMDRDLLPGDRRVDRLATAEARAPFSGRITLGDVEPGEERLVYVDAIDSQGSLIGNGCRSGIKVPEGDSVAVSVTVLAL